MVLGAVVGATAPFAHMVFPKTAQEKLQLESDFENGDMSLEVYKEKKAELKAKYKFAGFTNVRRFAFAIGLPISLFVCSLYILVFATYLPKNEIKTGLNIAGSVFQFTAIYFIIWTLWWYKTNSDFSKTAYYLSIVAMSIGILVSLRFMIEARYKAVNNLKKLRVSILDFFLELRNVHLKNIMKPAWMWEMLDEEVVEDEARDELKKQIKKLREDSSKEVQKRLKEKAHEFEK